jgi:hypothetical protein
VAEEREEVPEEVTNLRAALAAFAAMDDDVACTSAVSQVLRDWPDLGSELRKLREQRVNRLRHERQMTWPEIASVIGEVTPERAQQIGKGLSGAQRKKNERAAKEQPGK